MRRHGYRRFWNRAQRARHLPPVLWTFPGAGNTWLRMLLDFSTGVYTGSIYGDMSLLPLLPGEGRCDQSVIAVKAHPIHIDSFDFVRAAQGHLFQLNITRKPQYLKCSSFRFNSAIAVVRNPYDAIWAEYKRYTNWKEVFVGDASQNEDCKKELRRQSLHSGALLRSCFSTPHFRQKARYLARTWKHMWFHYGRFEGTPGTRLLHIRYEDLLNARTRLLTLRKIVDFLRLSPAPSDEALSCALRLADNPHIHRDKRLERDNQLIMSAKHAYANESFVCQLWQLVGRTAARSGYAPFGGVQC